MTGPDNPPSPEGDTAHSDPQPSGQAATPEQRDHADVSGGATGVSDDDGMNVRVVGDRDRIARAATPLAGVAPTSMSSLGLGDTVKQAGAMRAMTEGIFANLPDTSLMAEFPLASVFANLPDTSLMAKFPLASVSANLPDTSLMAEFPLASVFANLPDTSVISNLPLASLFANLPETPRILDLGAISAFSNVQKSLADDVARLVMPNIGRAWAGQIDSIFKSLPQVDYSFLDSIKPFYDPELFKDLYERFKPRNLRDRARDIESIEAVMIAEGIPFCLVPDAVTVDLLLDAADACERRLVLRERAKPVFASCDNIVGLCVDPGLPESGRLIRAAIAAYDGGHPEAAQALATVVLDQLIAQHPNGNNIKGAKDGVQFIESRMGNRDSFFLLPLPVAHVKTHEIVDHDAYNRHATVHKSSERQLTPSNAVQAIMLATSLLGFYQGLW